MKKWIGLVCSLALIWCLGMTGLAEQAQPDLEPRRDTLTIKCATNDGEEDIILSGVGLSVTKVADVTCEGGNVTYTLIDRYASLDVSFVGMTASESKDVAKKLADFQDEKEISSDVRVSGGDGAVIFSGLEHGMYLVRQVSSSGVAERYTTYAPFLVMVPEVRENGGWNYEVTAFPKTTVKKEKTPPPEEPKKPSPPKNPPKKKVRTGDDSQMMKWAVLSAGAIVLIICILVLRHRSDRKS